MRVNIQKLHVNCFDKDRLQNYLNNFFKNVFTFGMNDEVLHTGYDKMCHYVFCNLYQMKE